MKEKGRKGRKGRKEGRKERKKERKEGRKEGRKKGRKGKKIFLMDFEMIVSVLKSASLSGLTA